ncbi:nemo Cozi domain in complex with Diubiquitin in C2 space group [Zopfochytrium polystomum]|nr:nemo Cozi domain in complex with Diubiquitin in C2 space group [Zopfochytrium polystomum]
MCFFARTGRQAVASTPSEPAARQLCVRTKDGDSFSLPVDRTDTVESVKLKIESMRGVPREQQRLVFIDGGLLWDHHFQSEEASEIHVHLQSPHNIQGFVKVLDGEGFSMEVEQVDSVESVKLKVEAARGIPFGRQRIIFAGKQLDDHRTLSQYGVQKGSTLYFRVG